jgi:hypothetical protein
MRPSSASESWSFSTDQTHLPFLQSFVHSSLSSSVPEILTEILIGSIRPKAALRVRQVRGIAARQKGGFIANEVSPKLSAGTGAPRSWALALRYLCLGADLDSAPRTNVAVQGQTGVQPEGAFLNFTNRVGNVIAPVGAGAAVVGAIVAWLMGRGFGRWFFAAGALLAVSGVTRLIEFWITNGTGGLT